MILGEAVQINARTLKNDGWTSTRHVSLKAIARISPVEMQAKLSGMFPD